MCTLRGFVDNTTNILAMTRTPRMNLNLIRKASLTDRSAEGVCVYSCSRFKNNETTHEGIDTRDRMLSKLQARPINRIVSARLKVRGHGEQDSPASLPM